MNLNDFENKISQKIKSIALADDPAHDFLHNQRVVQTAKLLCHKEAGRIEVVMPAAWLHDFVIVPKNDPRRKQASQLSAKAAVEYLNEINYPKKHFDDIAHAISAHSFSANIATQTLEAEIVQDADRLDGLGAIGIARTFATAGLLKRPFYSDEDPFCRERLPNDSQFTMDHFFAKLFKTAETLKTKTGREAGLRRVQFMKTYLDEFLYELQ